jgi:putative Mg2+ transporter-C (MgtC) family protein
MTSIAFPGIALRLTLVVFLCGAIGVGFLGAGAIIHQGLAVRGLTTAAAVWISAAIGMAAGIGFYSLAITGTAVVLIALLVFRHIRTGLLHRVQSDRFLVEVEVEPDRVGDMLDLVAEHDAVLESLDCDREGDLTAVRLHLRMSPGGDRAALVQAIEADASVASAHAKRGLELAA